MAKKKKKKANRTLTKIGSAVQNKVNKVYSYNSLFSPVNTQKIFTQRSHNITTMCVMSTVCVSLIFSNVSYRT